MEDCALLPHCSSKSSIISTTSLIVQHHFHSSSGSNSVSSVGAESPGGRQHPFSSHDGVYGGAPRTPPLESSSSRTESGWRVKVSGECGKDILYYPKMRSASYAAEARPHSLQHVERFCSHSLVEARHGNRSRTSVIHSAFEMSGYQNDEEDDHAYDRNDYYSSTVYSDNTYYPTTAAAKQRTKGTSQVPTAATAAAAAAKRNNVADDHTNNSPNQDTPTSGGQRQSVLTNNTVTVYKTYSPQQNRKSPKQSPKQQTVSGGSRHTLPMRTTSSQLLLQHYKQQRYHKVPNSSTSGGDKSTSGGDQSTVFGDMQYGNGRAFDDMQYSIGRRSKFHEMVTTPPVVVFGCCTVLIAAVCMIWTLVVNPSVVGMPVSLRSGAQPTHAWSHNVGLLHSEFHNAPADAYMHTPSPLTAHAAAAVFNKSRASAVPVPTADSQLATRVAFGSCLEKYISAHQPVWDSVVSTQPDAWIWLGDFVYLDYPMQAGVNCSSGNPLFEADCDCDITHRTHPPFCFVGDVNRSRDKYAAQLKQADYRRFINYMCGDDSGAVPKASAAGNCARPVLGVWDDHDFGWNDGDRRLESRHDMKLLYLDALSESDASPRRTPFSGMEGLFVMNSHSPGHEIAVFLLDERYYRDPPVCSTRWKYCSDLITEKGGDELSSGKAFCNDFLKKGTGCCDKDDFLFSVDTGWCNNLAKHSDAHDGAWLQAVCNFASPTFGTELVSYTRDQAGAIVDISGKGDVLESPFCEMLGLDQRTNLAAALSESKAPVNILASGSVFIFNPDACLHDNGLYDSWECRRPAQVALLNSLIRADVACPIFVTGDFHFADLKVLRSDNTAYPSMKKDPSNDRQYTLFQVMASGMSDQIASEWHGKEYDTRAPQLPMQHNDPLKFRPHTGDTNEVPVHSTAGTEGLTGNYWTTAANFGTIEVDWVSRELSMRVHYATDGSVAFGFTVGLDECTNRSNPS